MSCLNAKDYGALGDGSGTTIAAHNTSITQPASYRRPDWVGVYADTDTMDYAGLQEAIYAAFGSPGAEHSHSPQDNDSLYIPSGSYVLSQTLRITRTAGVTIYGDGRFATQLWINAPNRPIVHTNGFSSSHVMGIGFFAAVDNPLDINNANPARRNKGVLFELDWDTRKDASVGLADTAVASATQVAIGPTSAVSWTTNQFAGKYLWIVAGAGATGSLDGAGTIWKIKGNSSNQLFIDDKWTVATPDGTTKFVITDTPALRAWDNRPWARGVVGNNNQNGALPTSSTLPKMANNASYWNSHGPYLKDGFDARLWQVNEATWTGDGTTTLYSYANAGMSGVTTKYGVGVYHKAPGYDEVALAVDVDYTVNLGNGTITLTSPLPSGDVLSIRQGVYHDQYVLMTSGAGAGQWRQILNHTDRVILVAGNGAGSTWSITPASFDYYVIVPTAPTAIDHDTPFTADPARVSDATLTVSGSPTWTLNQFADQEIWIVDGTGKGEKQIVETNGTDGTLTVARPWDTVPDATSVFRIIARPVWAATLQADRFSDCEFSAEGRDVGAGVRCVLHGDAGQGSEMHFLNCFFNWFRRASYINLGFNALQNTFVSGDFQSCRGHGFWVVSGAIQAYDVGFQPDSLGALSNGGYDFHAENSAGDHSILSGCRSEGYGAASVSNFHTLTLIGYGGNSAEPGVWTANNAYHVGDMVYPSNAWPIARRGTPYICIKAVGNRQSGGVEPNFGNYTYGEELVDNMVTWSEFRYSTLIGENVHARDSMFNLGTFQVPSGITAGSSLDNCSFSRVDWLDQVGTTKAPSGMMNLRNVHVHLRGEINDVFNSTMHSPPGSSRSFRSYSLLGGGMGYLIDGGVVSSAQSKPVGFRRGDWDPSRQIVGVIGTIGRESPVDHSVAGEGTPPGYLSDTKGEDMVIAGGISTGNASTTNANDSTGDGRIVFRVSPGGSAGSTANPLTDAAFIDRDRRFYATAPATSPTDSDIPNSGFTFYLDESGNALKVRVRKSDGTYKTATLALA